MKIADMMTKHLKTCRPDDTLDVAAKLMWECDVGAIPIVNELDQIVGIVTDRDACMAAYTQCQPLNCLGCSVAMSNHVVTCRPEDTVVSVARLMAKNQIRRVPVVDDQQRPIGIVSLNDLALATTHGRVIPSSEVAQTLAAICEHRASPPTAKA